jgi:hypothetical protein
MTVDCFKYDDKQWMKLEAIVSRAGGDAARQKFAGRRANFEKQVGGWKIRIAAWDGYAWGHDDKSNYERAEKAALELVAALDDLNFPAIFSGNDLLWKSLGELSENLERFSKFRDALNHVGSRARRMAARGRKRKNYARDRFFAALMQTWRIDLGLHIGVNADASLIREFVECASVGVLGEIPTKSAISDVIRRWKPGIESESEQTSV